jgi:hypothetical protein
MLQLTDKEIRKVGENRFLNKNNPIFYVLLVIVVIGLMLFVTTSDSYYTDEYNTIYKEVNGDNTITIEYDNGMLVIDDISYDKVDNPNKDIIYAVESLGILLLITGAGILAWLMINADKQGKILLEENKSKE